MAKRNLVLWGHCLQDYKEMLALDEADLNKRIVDCGAGAASFNVDMKQLGHEVMSCDEMYAKDKADLTNYIREMFDSMLLETREHQDLFVWDENTTLDDVAEKRRKGINRFLDDYDAGKAAGRYRSDPITKMPFEDFAFDLAVCSHYLYSLHDEQDADYHIKATMEMCRIAKEVRVFPLIDSAGEISPLVGPVMLALQQNNFGVEIREVPYQFQKNGNAMMRVWALQCDIEK